MGTLQQNTPDIPRVMKASKSREFHRTEFGFNGSMTMTSYATTKGKAVLLLSTMHHSKMVGENSQKKKTEMILFYNQTKEGLDTVDQMFGNYSCNRQTQVAHVAVVQHD